MQLPPYKKTRSNKKGDYKIESNTFHIFINISFLFQDFDSFIKIGIHTHHEKGKKKWKVRIGIGRGGGCRTGGMQKYKDILPTPMQRLRIKFKEVGKNIRNAQKRTQHILPPLRGKYSYFYLFISNHWKVERAKWNVKYKIEKMHRINTKNFHTSADL